MRLGSLLGIGLPHVLRHWKWGHVACKSQKWKCIRSIPKFPNWNKQSSLNGYITNQVDNLNQIIFCLFPPRSKYMAQPLRGGWMFSNEAVINQSMGLASSILILVQLRYVMSKNKIGYVNTVSNSPVNEPVLPSERSKYLRNNINMAPSKLRRLFQLHRFAGRQPVALEPWNCHHRSWHSVHHPK